MSLEEISDSDEADRELLQRVKSSLHHRGYRAIRTLEIQIERGTAVLQGRVPTFYMLQIAVECVKRVTGVTQIIDRIDVVCLPDCFQVHAENGLPAYSAKNLFIVQARPETVQSRKDPDVLESYRLGQRGNVLIISPPLQLSQR